MIFEKGGSTRPASQFEIVARVTPTCAAAISNDIPRFSLICRILLFSFMSLHLLVIIVKRKAFSGDPVLFCLLQNHGFKILVGGGFFFFRFLLGV